MNLLPESNVTKQNRYNQYFYINKGSHDYLCVKEVALRDEPTVLNNYQPSLRCPSHLEGFKVHITVYHCFELKQTNFQKKGP